MAYAPTKRRKLKSQKQAVREQSAKNYDYSQLSLDQITFLLDYLDRDRDLYNYPGRNIDVNAIIALKAERRFKQFVQQVQRLNDEDHSPWRDEQNYLKLLDKITPATDEERERVLLQLLNMPLSDTDCLKVLWELVGFYQSVQRSDIATAFALVILESTEDAEEQACCYRCLGGHMELQREYDMALKYYEKGLALKPTDKSLAYFLHNNSGYCLNLAGRHQEAERMCRKAIEIDPARHNAWKNLGLSLEGRGDLVGAAWSFAEATKINPRDTRALMLLQQLIHDHPELRSRFPGVLVEEAACKEATAAELGEGTRVPYPTYEICRLKKISGKGYLLSKNGAEQQISEEAIEQIYTKEALLMLDYHPNIWVPIIAEDRDKLKLKRASASDLEPQRMGGASGSSATVTNSDFVPCLVVEGELLERLKEH
jgi:tetratricopeptide (TPR) repeat protein